MQNKGLVRIMAILLGVVCAYYFSFTVAIRHHEKKAAEYVDGEQEYFKSIAGEKVWMGCTLQECREREIALGLDLKGGMNITMEVSVPDVLVALSGDNQTPLFKDALAAAKANQAKSTKDFLTLFIEAFEAADPNAKLASVFSTYDLKDKIALTDDNAKVAAVLQSEVEAAIENSFKVLRQRIDRFGVVQPNIQPLKGQLGRVMIELPGVKEPERVKKLLQSTANLEFYEMYYQNDIYRELELIDAELAQVAAPAEAEDSLAANVLEENHPLFAKLLRPQYPVQVGIAYAHDTAEVMSILTSSQAKQLLPRDLHFAWTVKAEGEEDAFALLALKTQRDGRPCLNGDVVTDARKEFQQGSAYAHVSMSMNAEGAKAWARITKENIGKCIAVVLDGYVYSYPTVQNEITGGNSQITGHFTLEEAEDLANTLKSGKMPARAHVIQEDVVGPSLGAESIKAGLISFAIAFCLILIYMIFYYGLIPGLIADCALICNVILLLGILISFGSVLTLPGIAGIVLTMGMAVDANVLIFERIREEMKAGKGMRKAVEDGYKGAITAIVDANVTSLLTGIVLVVFGTGPIKGFAVTFIIGIVSTFLTAVFFARLLLDNYVNSKNAKELPFTTAATAKWFQGWDFDFLGARKIAYTISGILVVASVIGFFYPGLNKGIDFTGGRNYVVNYSNVVKVDEVRSAINDEIAKAFPDEKYGITVIAIGTDGQRVRVSTNVALKSLEMGIDEKIADAIFEASKPFLAEQVSREDFVNTENEIGIESSQMVDASIADDIKKDSVLAIAFALFIVALYIFIRFRNLAFSVGALVSLAHDSIIIIGVYALCWNFMPFSMEVDQAFIAAILTVIGYSINDTVVIFDRIREYTGLYPKRDRQENINNALNSTLSRTFSTSMSTFVVLAAIFAFGGASIRGFVFALLLGVIIGTYSSLFIASPVAFGIQQLQDKRKADK